MAWYNKVVWSEGLFLRPHHLQQADRYLEHLVETRVRQISPYPWGFSAIEIDRDLAQQSKFALRRAAGVMPDGTPFDLPMDGPLPAAVEVPEAAAGQMVWLTIPAASPNTREVDAEGSESASRWVTATDTLIDSTSHMRIEEAIDVAYPRLAFSIRRTPRPGFVQVPVARILEVHDRAVILDETFAPPLLVTTAHATVDGWLDRVIGWIANKLDELARYAADPSAGGGLQSADYFMLQTLNRTMPVLAHFRGSRYVHPERLYVELLRLAGELATYTTPERRTRDYPPYEHDDLQATFEPVLRHIQESLSSRMDRRAIRLELVERGPNAYISTIRDRTLFQNATFVLEVSSRRPLTEIQSQFPNVFKLGPNTKMNDIVHAHLPGVPLVHIPTPPPAIRAISDHVYFYLDRTSPLWPEFSTASAIGMHFAGNWPDLALELWAVREDRR